jgi:hypothetical protein
MNFSKLFFIIATPSPTCQDEPWLGCGKFSFLTRENYLIKSSLVDFIKFNLNLNMVNIRIYLKKNKKTK